ncbi:MAG: arginine decarboxylase, partial [Bacteroidota bacterium]
MKNTYFDLIDQTFYFPQDGFDMEHGNLLFHGIPIHHLIKKYGTPFKITYLPSIGTQIKKARNWFNRAIKSLNYQGKYYYCYCTKSAHYRFVLDEVLEHHSHLETSSAFDIDLIRRLESLGKIDKEKIIINNGFKTEGYAQKIADLINDGFQNVIPVCDNTEELDTFAGKIKGEAKIGIRIATEEEPNFEFYTSRLGVRYSEVISFYKRKIARRKKITLKMLHFFVDTGIKDTPYYWEELRKLLKAYCALKKICPTLKAINIGGGLPIRNSLGFEFNYRQIIKDIVELIHKECQAEGVEEPDIFTEFGSFTVGESGAVIFSVLGQKLQNDSEMWYIIDNSLMNTIPDSWGIAQRFVLLPIN